MFIQSVFFIREHQLISRSITYIASIKIGLPEVSMPDIELPKITMPSFDQMLKTFAVEDDENVEIETYDAFEKEVYFDIKHNLLADNQTFNIKCHLKEDDCVELLLEYTKNMNNFIPFTSHISDVAITSRGSVYEVNVKKETYTTSDNMLVEAKNKLNQIVDKSERDEVILKEIHDYLVENYNPNNESSFLDALITKDADSKSYALVFQYLASEYNIPVTVLSNQGHYFNVYKAEKDLIIDVYRDDANFVGRNNRILYDYFLKEADELYWYDQKKEYIFPEYYLLMNFRN
jgi:hypothetical protein